MDTITHVSELTPAERVAWRRITQDPTATEVSAVRLTDDESWMHDEFGKCLDRGMSQHTAVSYLTYTHNRVMSTMSREFIAYLLT